MHFFSFAVIGALASGALAVPLSGHVLHEKREYTSDRWSRVEKLDSDVLLPMRIGLTQSNLDKGYDLLMEVSAHDSPKYGKHYTAEEVHDLFAPAPHRVDAVRSWLESAGIPSGTISQSVNKQWIQFDATVADVEALLKTEYHVYEHDSGKQNIACEEYSIPAHIQEHVDYITPGIKLFSGGKPAPPAPLKRRTLKLKERMFGKPGHMAGPISKPMPKGVSLTDIAKQANGTAPKGCDTAITPACVKALYNITAPTLSHAGNQLGIFESTDTYAQADLNSFFAKFATNIPQGTAPTLHGIDGATAPVAVSAAGGESDLDFQLAFPIIYPQGTILFQTDDDFYQANYNFAGFFNNFLDGIDGSYCTYSAFGETGNSPTLDPTYPDPNTGGFKGQLQCGVYKPTNVLSISYGEQESDLPANYQQRQCNEWMKLALQGVSIVVASGDAGVAGRSSPTCLGSNNKIFSPDFPVTCPYITSAGATFLPKGADVSIDAETAVTRFPSGGGFSNIYPIPSYQASAVNSYLTNHPPPYKSYSTTNNTNIGAGGGIFNKAGRAYPDVSAVGDNIVIFNQGSSILEGGTSASTPVFASILNRINEERLAAGKTVIGFVNPVLYAHPEVLHDITVGSNPGCGTQGFSCAPGWDPVTGLGTPDYPKMLSLFMSLP